jgi:hypothetical protein
MTSTDITPVECNSWSCGHEVAVAPAPASWPCPKCRLGDLIDTNASATLDRLLDPKATQDEYDALPAIAGAQNRQGAECGPLIIHEDGRPECLGGSCGGNPMGGTFLHPPPERCPPEENPCRIKQPCDRCRSIHKESLAKRM